MEVNATPNNRSIEMMNSRAREAPVEYSNHVRRFSAKIKEIPIPCRGLINHATSLLSSRFVLAILTSCPKNVILLTTFATRLRRLGKIKTGPVMTSVTIANLIGIPIVERVRKRPSG
jgi:hypothetical protein